MNKSTFYNARYDVISNGQSNMEMCDVRDLERGRKEETKDAATSNPEAGGRQTPDGKDQVLCFNGKTKQTFLVTIYLLLFVLYTVYVGFALAYDAEGSAFVCVFWLVLLLVLSIKVFRADRSKPCVRLNGSRKHFCGSIKKRTKFIIRW